jgi:putative DNA primase/helicase
MVRARGDANRAAREAYRSMHGEDPPSANGHKNAEAEPERIYELSDLGNAERFIDQHGRRVRWCPDRKMFLVWDGKRWCWDEADEVVKLAQRTARSIYREAEATTDAEKQRAVAKFALASQNTNRINGMLAQAKPHLAVRLGELDADRDLFNVQNGTLDLRTGERKDHDPTDLITKISPASYDWDASAPRFEQFLEETLVDEDVIEFVQRFAGYSLSGDTRERVMAILYGGGKNGKTTLVELLTDVLGDYAQGTDVETILSRKHAGVGNDVAALKGARFVPTSEVEKGRRLAEGKVKALTGRDTITARFLFCEPFNFRSEFKLWLSTNNKPEIKGTDDAIWDRIRLVPFEQRFVGEAQDRSLPDELRKEIDGVLAWAVEGCLKWRKEGLTDVAKITEATEAYRAEQDIIAAFIEECCVVHEAATVKFSTLHELYKEWCASNHEAAEKRRAFSAQLNARGYETFNGSGNVVFVRNLGLPSNETPPDNDDAEKVNFLGFDKGTESNKTDEQGDDVVNYVDEELTFLTPEKSYKTAENGEEVNFVSQKTTTSSLKTPREERMQKTVNKVNSLTQDASTEEVVLTPEEQVAVDRLVYQGMARDFAISEVVRVRS